MKCKKCDGTGCILYNKDGHWYSKRCDCQNAKEIKNLVEISSIPKRFLNKTVSEYIVEDELGKLLKENVVSYVNGFKEYKEKGTGLYIYSAEKGTGKTHLACAIGIALINAYKEKVKFVTLSDLLIKLKSSFENDNEKELNKYRKTDLLIIDDIGTEKITKWVEEMIFNIIDYREKNMLPTIYTSNCKVKELKYDDRVKSRIMGNSLEVQAPIKDRRSVI